MKLQRLNKRKKEKIMNKIQNRRKIYKLLKIWKVKYILLKVKFHKNKKKRNNDYVNLSSFY